MDDELPSPIADVSAKEFRQARDELVAMGLLVVVEEIDPRTGELRKRWFHKKFAPRAD